MSNNLKRGLWKNIGKQQSLNGSSKSSLSKQNKIDLIHDPINQLSQKMIKSNSACSVDIKIIAPVMHYGKSKLNYTNNQNQNQIELGLNSPSKSKKIIRPPPLNIENHLFQTNQGKKYQKPLQEQKINKKIIIFHDLQSPRSPWMDTYGTRISHIKKTQDNDQMEFSIYEQDKLFQLRNQKQGSNKKSPERIPLQVIYSPKNNKNSKIKYDQEQQSPLTSTGNKVPYIKNIQGVPISRIGSQVQRIKQQQIEQMQQFFKSQNQSPQFKSRFGISSVSNQNAQKLKEFQSQLKLVKQQLNHKNQFILNLKGQIKSINKRITQMKSFFQKQLQKIPEKLKEFKQKYIVQFQVSISQKVSEIAMYSRTVGQKYMEEQYSKRKNIEQQLQILRKKFNQNEKLLHQIQTQKSKLQKQLRQFKFNSLSSNSQLSELSKKVKSLTDQKTQLKIEVQSLQQRNKSMKQHLDVLNKNIHQKNTKQGQSEDDLYRKNIKMKKLIQQKQQEILNLQNKSEKSKKEQQRKLQNFQNQFRQIEMQMIEIRKHSELQMHQLKQQIREQQFHHQETKQKVQRLQVKIKQKQLQHYKQIQLYDNTLRQIQKDLEILSLKKNLKEEQLNKKQNDLLKLQNQLKQKNDLVRQQRNQLQCAIQLYKKNLLLLQKKQNFMTSKYHEAVEIQASTKAAWYERYYKLYSPSALTNIPAKKAEKQITRQKEKSQKQAQVQYKSYKVKNSTAFQPPVYTDIKKMVINQRLQQIQTMRNNRNIRLNSPRQNKTQSTFLDYHPLSPRVNSPRNHSPRDYETISHSLRSINLIQKARSVDKKSITSVGSFFRSNPKKQNISKSNFMSNLGLAKSVGPKPLTTHYNKQFQIVKAKIQQIKGLMNNQITLQKRN